MCISNGLKLLRSDNFFVAFLVVPELIEFLIFSFEMESTSSSLSVSGAVKRRSRSDTMASVSSRTDLHSVAEFMKHLPQATSLDGFDGLNREEPAVLRKFVAAEYKDTHRRVSDCLY